MIRLDISYAVSRYARYLNHLISTYNETLKRIIRYLASTRNLEIPYSLKENNLDVLISYTNSSWRNYPDTRRSTSGYVF